MKLIGYVIGLLAVGCLLFFAIGFFIPFFEYDSSVSVDRSPADCFAFYMDENKTKEWMPSLKEFTLISGERDEPGSKYSVIIEENGERFEMVEEIKIFERNKRFAYEVVSDVMTMNVDVTFDDLQGKTEIISHSYIVGRNLFWRSMLALNKGNFEKQDQQLYDRLKEAIEAQ